MSEPLQNRSQKRVVFQHRFFRVLASISEGLGPPRWSQVGSYSPKKLWGSDFFTILNYRSFENGILEASGLDFGGLGPPFWKARASFSKALDVIFGTTNAKNGQKPAKTKTPS